MFPAQTSDDQVHTVTVVDLKSVPNVFRDSKSPAAIVDSNFKLHRTHISLPRKISDTMGLIMRETAFHNSETK